MVQHVLPWRASWARPTLWLWAWLGVLALMLAAPPVRAQTPALPTVSLQSGIHLIQAEVAADEASRARGLMHRISLKPNQGMLFVFPSAGRHCFWMRNTLIPLSIAFIDDYGTITHVADMTPQSEDSHCPPGAVRFALEMQQGWFAQRGIKPGHRLLHPSLFAQAPAPHERLLGR